MSIISRPVAVTLSIEDPVLAQRTHAAVTTASGFRFAAAGETAEIALIQSSRPNGSPGLTRTSKGLASGQLTRASGLILAQLSQTHSLAKLAREVRLSPFHFSRAFKATTGVSPRRYLIIARVARAREMLTTTDKSVIDIAAAVGYPDPSYFARIFRKETGMTPRQYRRARQDGGRASS